MISEDRIEAALTYLRESVEEAAKARSDSLYLEAHMKAIKASLKARSEAKSNAAAEDEALSSKEYRIALEGWRVAVELDATHRFKREAAVALIDAWRTQQSNARAEGRAG